jgi:hypothetical protein
VGLAGTICFSAARRAIPGFSSHTRRAAEKQKQIIEPVFL